MLSIEPELFLWKANIPPSVLLQSLIPGSIVRDHSLVVLEDKLCQLWGPIDGIKIKCLQGKHLNPVLFFSPQNIFDNNIRII